MFVISQFALHKSNMCKFNNISTYAIASGLVVYASIYLYLLFYNNDYVALFNKFIIYIIGIDLLLSTFYYFNTSKKPEQEPQSHNLNFEKNPNVELLNVPNVINVSSVSNDDSDEESISNDEESDFEIEETEDYDMEDPTADMNWDDEGYDDVQMNFTDEKFEALDDMVTMCHRMIDSGKAEVLFEEQSN